MYFFLHYLIKEAMRFIQETLPGLSGGVSKQAPAVRLKTQHTSQQNMINNIVEGVYRRPPLQQGIRLKEGDIPLKPFTIKIDSIGVKQNTVYYPSDEIVPIRGHLEGISIPFLIYGGQLEIKIGEYKTYMATVSKNFLIEVPGLDLAKAQKKEVTVVLNIKAENSDFVTTYQASKSYKVEIEAPKATLQILNYGQNFVVCPLTDNENLVFKGKLEGQFEDIVSAKLRGVSNAQSCNISSDNSFEIIVPYKSFKQNILANKKPASFNVTFEAVVRNVLGAEAVATQELTLRTHPHENESAVYFEGGVKNNKFGGIFYEPTDENSYTNNFKYIVSQGGEIIEENTIEDLSAETNGYFLPIEMFVNPDLPIEMAIYPEIGGIYQGCPWDVKTWLPSKGKMTMNNISTDNIITSADINKKIAVTGKIEGDFHSAEDVSLTIDKKEYKGVIK